MDFLTTLLKSKEEGRISEMVYENFWQLFTSYANSLATFGLDPKSCEPVFLTYLAKVEEQLIEAHVFQSFHRRITSPFDYYKLGLDFMKPLVIQEKTQVFNLHNVDKMMEQINAGHNVVLFANHQTEVDPQLISIVLEKTHPFIATEIIFVAGDRVIADPMAKPFSMGRNLLCIYSKRHIENPPEKKLEKQHHNQRTMKVMRDLFSEGGKCVYVAPSGGRDRPDASGKVDVAAFDPQSIEMFRLMAEQAERQTHFYSLALATYDILPPPNSIYKDLGEIRKAKRVGVLFSFGDEIDMNTYPGSDLKDRHERREARAKHIWNLVKIQYDVLKTQ